MSTLTTPPLSTLLPSLFEDADRTQAALRREMAALPPDERAAVMALGQTDYRALYERAIDYHLAVSRETAKLLYVLARASGARAIVELGTSFGVSTLHLAAALRDNGGGRVITTELSPHKVARARETFAAAGLSDLVEVREGDALDTLARDLPDTIDLVLLDGAKVLYPRVLAMVEPRLRGGAMVIADNAGDSPEYLTRVRDPESGYLSVPFGGDVEVSMRMEGPRGSDRR